MTRLDKRSVFTRLSQATAHWAGKPQTFFAALAIIDELNLRRPIYRKTAAYGHFGRELPEFTWEATDKAEALKKACNLA